MAFKPGWFHTSTTVNGRKGPSTTAKIINVAKPGHNFKAVRSVTAGGREWLVSNRGTYYAAAYCKPGQVKAPARISTPVPGQVAVTTPWRKRPNGWPRHFTYWRTRGYHTGSDRAAGTGTKVVAVRSGRVLRLWDGVLGNVALLYADNGQTYWYCHLSAYLVKSGATVKAGQAIGRVGATGTGANGPHLHLERRGGHTTRWSGPDLNPETW